ncbi:transcription antitermination factor NusB [Candidatus Epulonipiscium fishelsonii]|uniref:Transcription antitermination factor NusB n=1 Tax=Candidatus Epulonipiscium fishelsonii TaxID=77094 RepID=A0ACC8XI02_9FIRM|nr:transcription antitermination factor NusB [Epulopiscium sp. SCG-D08WGA-EpuloA1]OON97342.1 MAG: transcription antitermination factor NusB [Epulopiscium sp. AS2M-Bin002]
MTRREAREIIMQMLYEKTVQDDIKRILEERTANIKGKIKTFIIEEFEAILEKEQEIENILKENLINWSLDRVSKVDYAILKIAVYEIIWEESIPEKVSINECMEIAKIYSTEKSANFINGILGKINTNVGAYE